MTGNSYFPKVYFRNFAGRFAIFGALALAACAAPPPPPPLPPPPPPPVVVAPPAMPTPPLNAASSMTIPPLREDGLRDTIHRDLSNEETLWHFRSALNVAALNCQDAAYYRMADDYNLFLTTHKRALDRANRAIEAKFKKEYGRDSARVRDTHSTRVYNFFSLPPVMNDFCDAALALGMESTVTPPDQLDMFAARALPQLEGVFDRFFAAYEQYNRELSEWMVLYGSNTPQAASYGPQTIQPYNGQNSQNLSYPAPNGSPQNPPAGPSAPSPYGLSYDTPTTPAPDYSYPLPSPSTGPYGPATPYQLPPSAAPSGVLLTPQNPADGSTE